MVKGITRRVIVIKSPDPRLFDEAIFIVSEDAMRKGGVTGAEIIKQAEEVADTYVQNHIKKGILPTIPPPAFAVAGAALASLVWLAVQYLF